MLLTVSIFSSPAASSPASLVSNLASLSSKLVDGTSGAGAGPASRLLLRTRSSPSEELGGDSPLPLAPVCGPASERLRSGSGVGSIVGGEAGWEGGGEDCGVTVVDGVFLECEDLGMAWEDLERKDLKMEPRKGRFVGEVVPFCLGVGEEPLGVVVVVAGFLCSAAEDFGGVDVGAA